MPTGVLFAWLVEIGVITWRDIKQKRTVTAGLPPPGDYGATFVVYGALAAIGSSPKAQTFAAVTAWGFVVATATNLINPTFVKTGLSAPATQQPPPAKGSGPSKGK